ncbi:ADP-ribose pyrophosphatase, mitochondrial-like [Pollicipes pollicipes]|uniref:ADP-ribose pyrophosphatase, mitochondrial-like n=1 Tax=Pollicipes pollicipes TaxID=41117 RepID=UPI0018857890|nr:ADP-ribose pyrophosphatase, mitochondrial-like [Pollicipes pollicipes]XP_037091824.1 ADP-ribose pyrophosphatase, mitochondrial-like [Pollicipes pollicipes]
MRRLLSGCSSLPMKLHVKCRGGLYPLSDGVQRADVPEDRVAWSVAWPEYAPVAYTSPVVPGKPWADPELSAAGFQPRWNALDGGVDRRSQQAEYALDAAGAPLNPVGRTGVSGRGLLGRWGPNHAADPLVTRWRRAEDGTLWRHPSSGRPQLQLVTVQRRDCGLWALPGGMVDPGERVTAAVQREFQEEALNALEASPERRRQLAELVRQLFAGGRRVYAGYVDDPRNTDNAWMETEAYNFHDETGTAVGAFPLQAGDDARAVRWTDVSGETELYASHSAMVQAVAETHGARW